MGGEGRVRMIERVVERGGTITARALAEVHPEVRGLTVSQYRVLVLIANAPDGIRVGELARRSSSRPSATSKIVGRLEAQGLVWVERGAQADRRAVVIRLTDQGTRTWAEISTRRRELIEAALAGVELPPGADEALGAVAAAFERYTA